MTPCIELQNRSEVFPGYIHRIGCMHLYTYLRGANASEACRNFNPSCEMNPCKCKSCSLCSDLQLKLFKCLLWITGRDHHLYPVCTNAWFLRSHSRQLCWFWIYYIGLEVEVLSHSRCGPRKSCLSGQICLVNMQYVNRSSHRATQPLLLNQNIAEKKQNTEKQAKVKWSQFDTKESRVVPQKQSTELLDCRDRKLQQERGQKLRRP